MGILILLKGMNIGIKTMIVFMTLSYLELKTDSALQEDRNTESKNDFFPRICSGWNLFPHWTVLRSKSQSSRNFK
jgi:hypothetical protein